MASGEDERAKNRTRSCRLQTEGAHMGAEGAGTPYQSVGAEGFTEQATTERGCRGAWSYESMPSRLRQTKTQITESWAMWCTLVCTAWKRSALTANAQAGSRLRL